MVGARTVSSAETTHRLAAAQPAERAVSVQLGSPCPQKMYHYFPMLDHETTFRHLSE